jgi:hypothetical protein
MGQTHDSHERSHFFWILNSGAARNEADIIISKGGTDATQADKVRERIESYDRPTN